MPSPRALPTGQEWFINKAKAWLKADASLYDQIPGLYAVHATLPLGVCHGYAQAAMLLEWEEIKDILCLINDLPQDELIPAIERALKHRSLLVNSVKQAMVDWQPELIENKYLSLTEASQVNPQEVRNYEEVSLAQKKRLILDALVDKQLEPREKLLLKLPAFFEAVMIAHRPEVFTHGLLNETTRGQDAASMLPLIMSQAVAKNGGLVKLPAFSVCLTRQELACLFDIVICEFRKKKDDFHDVSESVIFQLESHYHTIFIKYFPQLNSFRLFDINNVNLADKEIPALRVWELACLVFNYLGMFDKTNPYISFSIQLAALSVNIAVVRAVFDSCVASERWQSLNQVTLEKATARMWRGDVSWLLIAAKCNDTKAMIELLSNNADVNCGGRDGATPLFVAAAGGHVEAVNMLLSHQPLIDKACDAGETPLFIAAQYGHVSVVIRLLEAGANVERVMMKEDLTPLMIALGRNHIEVGRALVKFHANPNRAYLNSGGATLLHYAVGKGQLEWVKLLLEAGAEVDKPADNGATPIFIAAQNGHEAIVDCLLQHGANPASLFVSTKSSLMAFASSYSKAVQEKMRDFVNDRCDLFSSKIMMTPSDIAKIMGHEAIVELIRMWCQTPSPTTFTFNHFNDTCYFT